jgi:DNA-binding transcriptional ArsR family regulator
MLKQLSPVEDLFRALGDPARRSMVERLSEGPASVSDLAAPLDMTLSAVVQHLAILQDCGLVRSKKVGRVRTCNLAPGSIRQAENWFAHQREAWERRLDRLGEYLAEEADTPDRGD